MISFLLLSLTQGLKGLEFDSRSTTLDPYPNSLKVPDPPFKETLQKNAKVLARGTL